MTVAPLYVSEQEAAKLLGHNVTWLRSNASVLERQYGFPKIDPATQKRHRGAIEAWAEKRNMHDQRHTTTPSKNVENLDGF